MQQQTLQKRNDITLHTNYPRTNSTDNLANNTGSENNYFTWLTLLRGQHLPHTPQ